MGISKQGVFSNMAHWPTVLLTDGNRRELPYRRQLLSFWQELGILVFGGGLDRLVLDDPEDADVNMEAATAIVKERKARGEEVTVRQVVFKFMSQTGLSGPGPVLPQTRNLTHLTENL